MGHHYGRFVGVPPLNLTNGVTVLQLAQISPALTNHFVLTINSTTVKITSPDKLSMGMSWTTGSFKGTAFNPATGASIPISGVVLKDQNAGFGFFINGDQSGSVFLGPDPNGP
jgi:hypothetical protein